jgi:uncharacterized protein (TIGR02246 family)
MELWELIAREEIRDLVARYNSNGDSGRFDEVLTLFAPDAVMELPEATYEGHDEIRSMFTGAAASFASRTGFRYLRHFTATLQIDVLGPSEARGRCYYAVLMSHGLDHWGRYVDEYTTVDGKWRFHHRRVTVDGEAGSN